MSRSASLHRLWGMNMKTALAVALAALLAANGVAMLLCPAAWYAAVPGVMATGPFNAHFVRDVGAAYLAAGAALGWFAARPEARPAALTAAAFLGLHALVHIADAVAGRGTWSGIVRDLPAVFLPPVLIVWLAWRPTPKGDIR